MSHGRRRRYNRPRITITAGGGRREHREDERTTIDCCAAVSIVGRLSYKRRKSVNGKRSESARKPDGEDSPRGQCWAGHHRDRRACWANTADCSLAECVVNDRNGAETSVPSRAFERKDCAVRRRRHLCRRARFTK